MREKAENAFWLYVHTDIDVQCTVLYSYTGNTVWFVSTKNRGWNIFSLFHYQSKFIVHIIPHPHRLTIDDTHPMPMRTNLCFSSETVFVEKSKWYLVWVAARVLVFLWWRGRDWRWQKKLLVRIESISVWVKHILLPNLDLRSSIGEHSIISSTTIILCVICFFFSMCVHSVSIQIPEKKHWCIV